MKAIAILIIFLAMSFAAMADSTNPFENFSPHFSTTTEIVWLAPTNHLPKSFWIYKKLPRVFPEMTISNAIILASFQAKGFPQSSTNRIVIWDHHFKGEMEPRYFEITPDAGEMSYSMGDQAPDSLQVSSDAAAVQRAWNCLAQLGIDRTQLLKTNAADNGVWGVFIPRQIDGIEFMFNLEGFSFQQFGDSGKMRGFSLDMPNLERYQYSPAANARQIADCIRAVKTPVIADNGEPDYLGRVKSLSKAKKFLITKITPYYTEGIYGETSTNYEPPVFIRPIAILDAIADFGNSNSVVSLYCPILSSDVNRLLVK